MITRAGCRGFVNYSYCARFGGRCLSPMHPANRCCRPCPWHPRLLHAPVYKRGTPSWYKCSAASVTFSTARMAMAIHGALGLQHHQLLTPPMPDINELRLLSCYRNAHQQEWAVAGERSCSAIAAIAERHVHNCHTSASPPLPVPSAAASHAALFFECYQQASGPIKKRRSDRAPTNHKRVLTMQFHVQQGRACRDR